MTLSLITESTIFKITDYREHDFRVALSVFVSFRLREIDNDVNCKL